jgi:hypothetical protein
MIWKEKLPELGFYEINEMFGVNVYGVYLCCNYLFLSFPA